MLKKATRSEGNASGIITALFSPSHISCHACSHANVLQSSFNVNHTLFIKLWHNCSTFYQRPQLAVESTRCVPSH